MGFLDRFRRGPGRRNNPFLGALEAFAAERKGVEGYVEPETASTPTTLLLVDRDGDHLRAPIDTAERAVRFCEKRGIPVYDAALVGYPRRMKDFQAGRRSTQARWDEAFEELQKRLDDE